MITVYDKNIISGDKMITFYDKFIISGDKMTVIHDKSSQVMIK